MDAEPIVSVLMATTEERWKLFGEWALWNWARQTYLFRELLVVSEVCVRDYARRGELLDETPIDLPNVVPVKWNTALDHAAGPRHRGGSVITVWGDDDWQHPERLSRSVATLVRTGAQVVGWVQGRFLDLWTGRLTHPWRSKLFAATAAAWYEHWDRFDPRILKASDSAWVVGMRKKKLARVTGAPASLWLVHGRNMSTERRHDFALPLEEVIHLVGPGAWGETTERLEALRERLR